MKQDVRGKKLIEVNRGLNLINNPSMRYYNLELECTLHSLEIRILKNDKRKLTFAIIIDLN